MPISRFYLCLTAGLLALALSACGSRTPFGDYRDCLNSGLCECQTTADCPVPLECINSRCGMQPDSGVTLKGFGERCSEDAECESDRCIPNGHGTFNVCSRTCEGDCPPGWDCKVRPEGEAPSESLCVQHLNRLCAECSVDDHCHPAFGDYCLTLDGIQGCGMDCTWETCPDGYSCQTVTTSAGAQQQCVPPVGSCRCTPASVGLVRSCTSENSFGICHGESTCLVTGEWSPCDATPPEPEVCNGVDDNCNGLVDADDPAVDISALPINPPYPMCRTGAAGFCEGRWTCQESTTDVFDWVCDAVEPVEEVCDGADNDCDGFIDEEFLDANGRYTHPNHCGTCELDCETVIANLATGSGGDVLPGAVTCELRNGSPSCVPLLCADGYAPYPEAQPVLCLELVSPQCRPCTSNGDCLLSMDQCQLVGDDPHDSCLQGCGTDAPYGGCTGQVGAQGCCPADSLCQQVGGALLCVPTANSCDCDADRVGAIRPCYLSGNAGAICVGQQVCEAAPGNLFAWSECDASETVVEVCDGEDNDCNGVIDDPFIDTQGSGTYDVDEHCGACNVNCLARWSQEIQHAIGGCVYQPVDPPDCEIVACTTETVGGGGTCRLDVDCGAGWLCHPVYHQCTRACNGPADCPGGLCSGSFCTTSCGNNAQCVAQYGEPSACVGGVCAAEYQFHNIDEVDSNGCECAAPVAGVVDAPDISATYPEAGWPYVDRNCDGVDGDLPSALFVWSGTDSSQGSREHPYRTIDEAITVFNPAVHSQILVAAGYYEETLILTAGVRLFGGYAPDFATRDVVLYPTLISGPEPNYSHPNHPRGVINAEDISGLATTVAGFVIYGFDVTYQPSAGQDGETTYAVFLRNCSAAVTIANNVILAGRGGEGGLGLAGSPGQAGNDGQDGLTSTECNTAQCNGETQPGGASGTNSGCGGAAGNPGAGADGDLETQGYPNSSGPNGQGGQNGTYSNANNPDWWYLCKYDCVVGQDMDGDDAQSGNNGSTGSGGNGCNAGFGTISGGAWSGGTGGTGSSGTSGNGGGGGGAGGCVRNSNQSNCTEGNLLGDLGSTGGGGGAGGCGGIGGIGGGAGGASFGVFISYTYAVATRPLILGNVIERGEGGPGGAGGYGGHGGLGGQGGSGGIALPPAWCAGYAGKGGRGGDGGGGGGGGGGCGGAAFGVAGQQIGGAGYLTSNVFEPASTVGSGGPGGSGGPSPSGGSANGSSGIGGQWGDLYVY